MEFFLHRDVFLTAQFKREHAQAVFDQLMEAKANCEERLYEEEQRFRKLFAMRQNTLGDMKVSIIFDCFKISRLQ